MDEQEQPRGPDEPVEGGQRGVQPEQQQPPPVETGALEEEQQGKGYGQDEGEREQSLDGD